ncbi:hypothetical protein CCU_24710 [Coprococcus sp. ART55/1]|nr:hypothetical protein CCU_24710 [Coprococcus sp. ART55/1]
MAIDDIWDLKAGCRVTYNRNKHNSKAHIICTCTQ